MSIENAAFFFPLKNRISGIYCVRIEGVRSTAFQFFWQPSSGGDPISLLDKTRLYKPDSLMITISCAPPRMSHFVTPLSSSSTCEAIAQPDSLMTVNPWFEISKVAFCPFWRLCLSSVLTWCTDMVRQLIFIIYMWSYLTTLAISGFPRLWGER